MLENPNKNIETLNPFGKFCVTLGMIPSSYKNSLTYEEQLLWFCNFLENEVIPAVNNNGEVVTELQNLFVQLQDYIKNYFNNLNIQNEINVKLDKMATDGTLTNLIKKYVDPIYKNFETNINSQLNSQNTKINTIENKVNTATSGSPSGVYNTLQELQSADPDHSKIYVVLEDGNWYYYNTNTSLWTSGGIYQGKEVENNSINYNKLSKNLQEFILNTSLNKNFLPNNVLDNYYIPNSDINLVKDNRTKILKIDVSNSPKIIAFDLKKYYDIFKTKLNPVINCAYITGTEVKEFGQLRFNRIPQNNLTDKLIPMYNQFSNYNYTDYNLNTLYFIIPQNIDYEYFGFNIKMSNYDLTDCCYIYDYNNFFNEYTLKKLINIPSSYINLKNNDLIKNCMFCTGYLADTTDRLGKLTVRLDKDDQIVIHKIENDTTYLYYKTISGNYRNYIPICSFDKDFNFIRSINSGNNTCKLNNEDYYYLKWERQENEEYLIFTSALDPNYKLDVHISQNLINKFSVTEINGIPIYNETENNSKKWYAIGDSITEKNYRALNNYVDYCANDLNINAINLGVSGTGYKQGSNTFIDRIDRISSYNLDNDIITVMGSINDISFVNENLGQLGDQTTETLYGSMYLFFKTLFDKFTGVRIGLITPICSISSKSNDNWQKYRKALIDTAVSFNVPYLDITDMCNLRPSDKNFLNEFYLADGIGNTSQIDTGGIHPNSKGHKLFYARIKEFLQSL